MKKMVLHRCMNAIANDDEVLEVTRHTRSDEKKTTRRRRKVTIWGGDAQGIERVLPTCSRQRAVFCCEVVQRTKKP